MAAFLFLWPTFAESGSSGSIGGSGRTISGGEKARPRPQAKAKAKATSSPSSPLKANGGGHTRVEMRTPEASSPSKSPCARQGDDGDGFVLSSPPASRRRGRAATPTKNLLQSLSSGSSSWDSNDSAMIAAGSPRPSKATAYRPKRTTAAEAYNKGLLLQYIIENCADFDCCAWDCTSEEYYESKWKGHQPLAAPTWHHPPPDPLDNSEGSAAGPGTTAAMSASELRLMRRRRRRGVLSPPRRPVGVVNDPRFGRENVSFAKVHSTSLPREPPLPGRSHEWSIGFPGEVKDPHLVAKKKWEPHPDEAGIELPLPLEMPRGKGQPGCILMPLPPGEEDEDDFLLPRPRSARRKSEEEEEQQPGCNLMPQYLIENKSGEAGVEFLLHPGIEFLLPPRRVCEEGEEEQAGCTLMPRCS